MEHRPSTTPCQRTRTWAFHSASFQFYPISFSSSVSRRQLFLRRPLFLFPWGFHLRACRVLLFGAFHKVWPIQLHFSSSQNLSTYRLLFPSLPKRIFSVHQMLKMRLRQLFESLDLLECLSCPSPRLRSIEENWFYIGIGLPSAWAKTNYLIAKQVHARGFVLVYTCITSYQLPESVFYTQFLINA